jgi:hypothetical protein
MGIAVEASGVSEIASTQSISSQLEQTIERSAWSHALDGVGTASVLPAPEQGVPEPFIGPRPEGARLADLPQLTGTNLLAGLSRLSRAELSEFGRDYPAVIAELIASPPAAKDVATWWTTTAFNQRTSMLRGTPQLIGALEGLPYSVRDSANRLFLVQSQTEIRQRMEDGVGRAVRDELTARLNMLSEVAAALETGPGEAKRTLVSLDATGEGRAVIAVGDLRTADYVSYLVPGMFFGVGAQIGAWTDTAAELGDVQRDWLERLADDADAVSTPAESAESAQPAESAEPIPTVATIAWIGYQTPSIVNVASMELAREGRDALTDSLEGLRVARGADQPYLAILAHSYGSTAALLALEENDVAVDALAMVGSPGSSARTVAELHVTGGNVWVAGAEWDPIPASGAFGSQPMSPEFGAHHFGVDGGHDPVTGEPLTGAVNHNDYFVSGGESFRNLALIGIGKGAHVTGNDGAPVVSALRGLERNRASTDRID